ncbi:MAG: serine beta-lactamase-like protein LACTB [Chlamydiales bacterium]|jgi:serine beta-lactamase-like protein LACTB
MLHAARPKLLALVAIPFFVSSPGALAGASDAFTGSWAGQFSAPFDPRPLEIRFGLEQGADGSWHGALDGDMVGPGLLLGTAGGEELDLGCDFGSGISSFRLTSKGEGQLFGVLDYGGIPVSLDFHRTAERWADDLHFEVVMPAQRPSEVSIDGLPEVWLEPIDARVSAAMSAGPMVGLALAVVIDGAVLDSRSWGWSDVERQIPVTDSTLFRWGSISKSITGLVSAKLAVEGVLDLDQDVRERVPEFPKKKHVVTTRLLLGHLGGLPHYAHMPTVTRVDYGVEFPFRDPVRAIDMFRAAPLIHEPGTRFSYSTHGYALVGAVIERSSKRGYLGEVQRLVSGPFEMKSLENDDPSAPRDARTTGYRVTADGRFFNSGDSNVAWKLAGGGFQSTVTDLGRFGAGLCDEYLLDEETRELLWTPQVTRGGETSGYALGFRIARHEGQLLVSHGGAQRRTRTFLVCAPEAGLAVALMSNTEGAQLESIGQEIMRVLLDQG